MYAGGDGCGVGGSGEVGGGNGCESGVGSGADGVDRFCEGGSIHYCRCGLLKSLLRIQLFGISLFTITSELGRNPVENVERS